MAHIGTADYVLMIHPDVPAKTAAEYIRYAKANPGKMNYATAGVGSAHTSRWPTSTAWPALTWCMCR